MGARGGKGRRRGEGRGQGSAPCGVCLRVPAAPPWSAAASDLHEGDRRASRELAGAGRWRGGYTRGACRGGWG